MSAKTRARELGSGRGDPGLRHLMSWLGRLRRPEEEEELANVHT
uniref:Uncharacterized protein n=1 Tax=Arundo donax TaxID=35708 RepID=A0A0A9B617_ARUDO